MQRLVRRSDHTRIPEAGVVDRRPVVVDDRLLEVRPERERVDVDLVEVEGGARRRDVAGDVLLLVRELVGLHLEVLHGRGIDRADDQRDEAPQADGDHREHPSAPADVPDEQQRGHDRDEDQEVQRGELRVHVGVPGAVDRPAVREVQLVATEVVLGRLDQRHHGDDHREVRLHLGRHALQRALEPDPAVEVVRDRGDQQHDHEPGEEPLEHELDERELEDVEADVLVELRILDAEVDAVREKDPLAPLRGHADARDQREEDRDADPDAADEPPGHLLVAGDHLVFRRHRTLRAQPGRQPVGDEQVRDHDHEEHDREHRGRHDLGGQQPAPGSALTERVEPQRVDVEAGQPPQAEQQHDDDDDQRDHPAAHAEPAPLVGRDAHRYGRLLRARIIRSLPVGPLPPSADDRTRCAA